MRRAQLGREREAGRRQLQRVGERQPRRAAGHAEQRAQLSRQRVGACARAAALAGARSGARPAPESRPRPSGQPTPLTHRHSLWPLHKASAARHGAPRSSTAVGRTQPHGEQCPAAGRARRPGRTLAREQVQLALLHRQAVPAGGGGGRERGRGRRQQLQHGPLARRRARRAAQRARERGQLLGRRRACAASAAVAGCLSAQGAASER